MAALVDGDLVPALDLEVAGGLGTTALRNWVAAWLAQVTLRTGIKPMIYVSPAFWKKYLGDTNWFAANGYRILWIAHWGVAQPTVPGGNWGGYGWTFWQYTDCGKVPGISGCVDLDRYNGLDLEPVTYRPGFRLSASPSSASGRQGGTAKTNVGVVRTSTTDPVAMSVSGLPSGATAAFAPSPAGGSSSTLTIATSKVSPVTPTGTYPLTVTGVGGGLTRTTSVKLVVTDGVAPSVGAPAPILLPGGRIGTSTTPARIRWSASDPSGIASNRLQRQVNGGTWSNVALPSAASTWVNQSFTFGATYRYRATSTDRAGNAAGWTYGRPFKALVTQQYSSAVRYHGTWLGANSSSASGGSLRYATTAGASATFTATGSSVAWIGVRAPNRGSARIYLDGRYLGPFSLRDSSSIYRAIAFAAHTYVNAPHTLQIVVVGTAGHPRIDVDAFVRIVLY